MVYVKNIIRALRSFDSRTKQVIFVACATYFGKVAQGLAVLVTLPMARNSLNPEMFGVWMMLSAFVGFMAFADFGVGNGVLNHVTKAKATDDKKLLQRTLVSGYAITGLVGGILFLVWVAWSFFSGEPTVLAGSISVENRPEVMRAFSVFAFLLAINIPASLILRVQLGVQSGYLNGLNQLVSALLVVAVVPLILRCGGSVHELVLGTLGVQVLVNVANSIIWLYFNKIFNFRVLLQSVDLLAMKSILKTGSMFFLLQIAAAFAFHSDAIVITQTLGQSVYGEFAVVQKIFLFIPMLLNAAMFGLWPAFGDAMVKNQTDWALRALKHGTVTVGLISVVGVGLLAVAMPWILTNWMNSTIQPGWGLILTLAIWTIIDGIANVVAAFLNGANILRAQLFLALCMAFVAFSVKWLLTPVFGPLGAVLSTILTYCVISVPGQIYLIKRALLKKD